MSGYLSLIVESTNQLLLEKELSLGTKVSVVKGPHKGAGGPIIKIDKDREDGRTHQVHCKEFGDVWNKPSELEVNK